MPLLTKGSIIGGFYFYFFLIVFIIFSIIAYSTSKARKHIFKK